MVVNESNHGSVFLSELRTPTAMALIFLPWLLVVLITSGVWPALNTFGYALLVLAVGYGIISAIPSIPSFSEIIVLAPAVGVLTVSALTTFWVRLGLPLIWVSALWMGLMAVGALRLWSNRAALLKSTVAYGGALVLLSTVVCLIYLLPGANRDAVLRHDGSFNWMYVDTQYNYAIVASIKESNGVPKEPGSVTAPLLYHFGGYAPAAAIARFDGLDLGDSFARVTRGVSLWALVLSCFGLGTLLSLKATGERFGGVMSVAGFFFYGSLLALFTDERNSSSQVTGAILFKMPEIGVGHDGGPFSHLVLGHSELHAFIAITAIMCLCLAQRESGKALSWSGFILLTLPAFAVAMHSVASLYCLGVAIILLFWGRLNSLRSWIQILLMFCLFILAWKTMGFGQAPDALSTRIGLELTQQWWTVAVGFLIGLGFRIVGFSWISRSLKDPLSVLALATVLGLLSFFLLVHFKNGEEIYGVFFLQSVLSIFAFSRLQYGFWRGDERSRLIAKWLRLAAIGTLVIGVSGVLTGAFGYATTHVAGIESFRIKILLIFLYLVFLVAASALVKRRSTLSMTGSGVLMGILSIGFLAWIAPWSNFGLGRMKMDVTLAPGEVQTLTFLKEHSAPDDRFATNKHEATNVAANTERSYAYASVAERPVLVEGFLYHQLSTLPGFENLLRDNNSMFTTTDPETLRELSRNWEVKWLVARPGTDIALPKPLPSWLVEQQNNGGLKIYRID